MEKRKKK